MQTEPKKEDWIDEELFGTLALPCCKVCQCDLSSGKKIWCDCHRKQIKSVEKENLVEIIDVWSPVESGGEAIRFSDGKHLKLIARFANGVPLILEKEFVSEKRYVKQEEYENNFKSPLVKGK